MGVGEELYVYSVHLLIINASVEQSHDHRLKCFCDRLAGFYAQCFVSPTRGTGLAAASEAEDRMAISGPSSRDRREIFRHLKNPPRHFLCVSVSLAKWSAHVCLKGCRAGSSRAGETPNQTILRRCAFIARPERTR